MKVKRSAICAGISVVRSARLGSFLNFCGAACTAALRGMLVNSNSTLKDTMISFSRIVLLLTEDTNSDFPVKGDKMLAKYADKSYAKVFMQDTIGLSGTSVLWIFSKTLILGGCLCQGLIFL